MIVVDNDDNNSPSTTNKAQDDHVLHEELPKRVEPTVLPPQVSGILECARHEIQLLLEESQQLTTANPDSEDALDDGFLCIDLQVLHTKLEKWHRLFPNVTPYFAIKCNPDPMVVHWLAKKQHVGFDCASLAELQLAKQELSSSSSSNVEMPKIVYANPQRAEADLLQAMTLFSNNKTLWLTVDGLEELYKIEKACITTLKNRSQLQLIIRILVPDGQSQIPLGEKFGMALESIETLVQTALQLGLPIIGVSFHCGSGCHDPETYREALTLAKQALEIINSKISTSDSFSTTKKCWLLDIGGGFPGWDGLGGDAGRFSGATTIVENTVEQDDSETAAAIARAIQPLLEDFLREGMTLIAEPGRYFVEASACMVSRIYKKQICGTIREYKIAHGVHGVFKDVLLCGESFVPMALPQEDDKGKHELLLFPSRVQGPSGDPNDVVCADCQLPDLQVGDWLVFDRMGAYTLSIASRTGRPIVRYVQGSGN